MTHYGIHDAGGFLMNRYDALLAVIEAPTPQAALQSHIGANREVQTVAAKAFVAVDRQTRKPCGAFIVEAVQFTAHP